jgi:hypothetical protein
VVTAVLEHCLAIVPMPRVLGSDPQTARMLARLDDSGPACASRLVLWAKAVGLIAQKPWWGWGWFSATSTNVLHHTAMFASTPLHSHPEPWLRRGRAGLTHLVLSLVVAVLAAGLVFGLWYPYPYSEISGGRELFLLVVVVDVVVGPLITLVVFDTAKSRQVIRRDLLVVVVLQLAALGYGMWTVYWARPVHLVFEYSRFTVVHAVEVPAGLLPKVPAGLRALPVWGPTTLSLRPFRDSSEQMEATIAALGGLPLGARPDLWQSYAAARQEVLKAAKPVAQLKQRFVGHASEIDRLVASTGHQPDTLVYLPMTGRKSFWTVFLDPDSAEVLAFMPLDSF